MKIYKKYDPIQKLITEGEPYYPHFVKPLEVEEINKHTIITIIKENMKHGIKEKEWQYKCTECGKECYANDKKLECPFKTMTPKWKEKTK